ncbi:MAG: GNAT family N-acetyltransferase [Thermoplasmata archaeon]|nr:MAG: GNAT family N-acetyltransferase [Thermoplasmata archaeon]
MQELEIRPIKNKEELLHIINIRKQVFVKEQQVPLHLEIDGLDTKARHIIVYLHGKPIGCARIRTEKEYVRLERIAIIKKYREKGYGKQLINYLINYCKHNMGAKNIRIHSQIHAADFYKKQGFRIIGKPFYEAGIKHIEMAYEDPDEKIKKLEK